MSCVCVIFSSKESFGQTEARRIVTSGAGKVCLCFIFMELYILYLLLHSCYCILYEFFMFNLFRDELAAQIQEESKRLEETRYCHAVSV